jgi:hypothetical protein
LTLILVALLFSPIYLWQSGLPQISHILAATAVGQRLLINKSKLLYFEREWNVYLLFILYISFVALTVYFLHTDRATIMALFYYLFGFVIFLEIITVFMEKKELFLVYVLWLHLFAIIIITAVSALGIGRIDYGDGVRMYFLFNNPNQMANWAVWSVVIISTCGWALYRSWIPGIISLIVSAALVSLSISRAGFVGITVLIIVYISLGLNALNSLIDKQIVKERKKIRIMVKIFVVLAVAILIFIISFSLFQNGKAGIDLFSSIIGRIINTDINFELGIRAYDRLWHYPQYLFFGAGEGATFRFAEKSSIPVEWNIIYEVHSNWAGLLFNYGLIGFCLFSMFLVYLIKNIKTLWFKLFLLGPFFFGFSNYNIRNWYFWVGSAIVYCCSLKLRIDEGEDPRQKLIDLKLFGKKLRLRYTKLYSGLVKKSGIDELVENDVHL